LKNILVPLSASLNNKQTLKYAVDFAAEVGCDVYVTSLFKIARATNLPEDVSVPAIAKQQLDTCIQSVDTKNVRVQSLPLEGDDIQESIELLHQKLHIDLVILAPQGLSINETLYLGEHAGTVVKRTQIPVLIVPVKTATFKEEDAIINPTLQALINFEKTTENSTLFQAVLEHLNENEPDIVCVFRRKQGFFEKLWDDNTVKKIDFESRIPLLVLKGAD